MGNKSSNCSACGQKYCRSDSVAHVERVRDMRMTQADLRKNLPRLIGDFVDMTHTNAMIVFFGNLTADMATMEYNEVIRYINGGRCASCAFDLARAEFH
jgi:fructose-1-phosphate kinase PfkB-like protein